jgi:hypothetical protein
MHAGKRAAVIALAISVVLPSATCGVTGAPTTVPWFTFLKSSESSEAYEANAEGIRIRNAAFLFIPRRATELARTLRDRISHEFPASTAADKGGKTPTIRVRCLALARWRCSRGIGHIYWSVSIEVCMIAVSPDRLRERGSKHNVRVYFLMRALSCDRTAEQTDRPNLSTRRAVLVGGHLVAQFLTQASVAAP